MRFRIGTQGWSYDRWIGPFYPPESGGADRLALYARAFDTVEINSTFYAVPPADRFRDWPERTPEDFEVAVEFRDPDWLVEPTLRTLQGAGARRTSWDRRCAPPSHGSGTAVS